MLVRWNPWNEMTRLQRDMNDLFYNRLGEDQQVETDTFAGWRPEVDVFEDAERFVLSAELPGIGKEDVDIRVEDHALTLSGERKMEFEERKENYHRIERTYGKFSRTFSLPETVEADKILAEYKQGVLRVTIPKKVQVLPKKIEIRLTDE
jgi:HSP20 family protein